VKKKPRAVAPAISLIGFRERALTEEHFCSKTFTLASGISQLSQTYSTAGRVARGMIHEICGEVNQNSRKFGRRPPSFQAHLCAFPIYIRLWTRWQERITPSDLGADIHQHLEPHLHAHRLNDSTMDNDYLYVSVWKGKCGKEA